MDTLIAATTSLNQEISPETMKAAGVPFPLARWYHLFGRHLTRFSEWDVERVMLVRLCVAQSGY
ncbi:MAG: hypothetical protein QM750_19860 [Rubrivivax sp.]